MDILQILELAAELEPVLLSFVQAIVTVVNAPPVSIAATGGPVTLPTIAPSQKAMLTSLMMTHRDMHVMLCDAMSKHYGITV